MPKAGNFFFIRSTKIRSNEVLQINDGNLWTSCGQVFQRIDELCGDGSSRLFAEPNVKAQDDGQAFNVAWFGSYDDEPKDLEALDRARYARITEDLTRRLDALKPALADPEIGDAVAAMLNVYDQRSTVAVGEHAVLTNWGALPEAATLSQGAYAKHSEATIGPFLKADMSPRLPGRSWTIAGGLEVFATSAAMQSEAGLPPATQKGTTAAAAAAPRILPGRHALWPPAVLAGVFGSILAYAAWPGNLVYEKQIPVSQNELDATADINRGLKERIDQLTAQLGKDPCQIDRSLLGIPQSLPNLNSPTLDGRGTTNRPGASPRTTPGSNTPAERPRAGNEPPQPQSQQAQNGDRTAERSSGQQLLATLDASTVLVVVPLEGGRVTGTGFFLTSTDIMTNRHVIEDRGAKVYVASKSLDKIVEATVVAQSDDEDADFALLRVPAQQGVKPLALSGAVNRLDDIVTGGFPGFVMETDSVYQNILRGDTSGLRSLDMVTTRGYVISMPHGGALTRIAHSAEISEGNSGGPLIDACGRAVGINTYVRRDQQIIRSVNYSLGAADVQRFAAANGLQLPIGSDRCQPAAPQTASTVPPPAAAAPGSPEPRTPGHGTPPMATPPGPATAATTPSAAGASPTTGATHVAPGSNGR